MTSKAKVEAGPTYRIGAVSRLTGVAPDTLRVWERRYGAVVPYRSATGSRLYSQEDISRLALIKRLVDGGDAISSVANLTMEQLQERAKGSPFADIESQLERPCRVVVLGTALPDLLGGEAVDGDKIELVGLFRVRDQFLSEAPKLNADLIVLEYATIQPDQIRDVGTLLLRSGAGRAIVVYRVAARSTLDRIESPRITTIRGPIDRAQLHRWCLALHARAEEQPGFPVAHEIDLSGPLPARRFDEVSLARIAAASVTVRCECPHHLVDLISNLTAFEVYSEECEVLNVDDAALHAYLHSATAQARSLLETALTRIVEADAIEY